MGKKHKAYLLTGANLGDRLATLAEAIRLIGMMAGTVIRTSSLYETEAWGSVGQPNYLNQALEIETSLEPHALLTQLQEIELKLGRIPRLKWASRTIDIDILFYDDRVLKDEQLTVPHPQMHRRNFVLIPMLEIAPEQVHPVLKKTVEELYIECPDELDVVMLEKEKA